MFYLYAVTDPYISSPAFPPGVGDVAPEIIPFADFSAIAAGLAKVPALDADSAHCHIGVLDAVMPCGTVLPARFGTVLSDREELERALTGHRDRLLADLRRLRGRVELGVCVTDRRALASQTPDNIQPPVNAEAPGARYIARKQAENGLRLRRARADAQLGAKICASDRPLAKLATESVWHARPGSKVPAISAAFLLHGERVDAFLSELEALRRAEPDLDFLCTGPWPPFSFVRTDDFS